MFGATKKTGGLGVDNDNSYSRLLTGGAIDNLPVFRFGTVIIQGNTVAGSAPNLGGGFDA